MEKATAREPDNAVLLNALGAAQYRCGLYQEAAGTLKNSPAGGKGTSDAWGLFFLAMCRHRLCDPIQARRCFDEAVRWMGQSKTLSVRERDELTELRREAEAELDGPR